MKNKGNKGDDGAGNNDNNGVKEKVVARSFVSFSQRRRWIL